MTEGLNYHATMSKGGREFAWNTGSHEKAGTMGEKTKHTDKPLTASEQYYANKMELKKRTSGYYTICIIYHLKKVLQL